MLCLFYEGEDDKDKLAEQLRTQGPSPSVLMCKCGLTRSLVFFVRLRCGSSGSAEALSRREIGPGGKGQSGRFEPRPPQASHALQWSDAISQAMVDRQGSWFSMEAKPERVHSLRYGLNDYPST